MLGCEVPIFAFSHCRDVVVEVTRAGGFGVLGASSFTPEQLEIELRWIDEHVDGKPYGLDIVVPGRYSKEAEQPMESFKFVVWSVERRRQVGCGARCFSAADGAGFEDHHRLAFLCK